jgi:hypothetical protein
MRNYEHEFRRSAAAHLEKAVSALSDLLEEWEDGISESLFPADAITEEEYPFTQSLDEVVSRIQRTIESLQRDLCIGCGNELAQEGSDQCADCNAIDNAPSLTWLEDHGISPDPYKIVTWEEAAKILAGQQERKVESGSGRHRADRPRQRCWQCGPGYWIGDDGCRHSPDPPLSERLGTPEQVARDAFRRMVTAFEGGYRHMVTAFEGGYHPDTTQYVRLPDGYSQGRVDEVESFALAVGLDLCREALDVMGEVFG